MTDHVRRSDAQRLAAKHAAHIAEIERDMIERILDRIRAGEDSPKATTEEVQRALARLAALSAAFEKALKALPSVPEPPSK